MWKNQYGKDDFTHSICLLLYMQYVNSSELFSTIRYTSLEYNYERGVKLYHKLSISVKNKSLTYLQLTTKIYPFSLANSSNKQICHHGAHHFII